MWSLLHILLYLSAFFIFLSGLNVVRTCTPIGKGPTRPVNGVCDIHIHLDIYNVVHCCCSLGRTVCFYEQVCTRISAILVLCCGARDRLWDMIVALLVVSLHVCGQCH